jgi:hypothetical protein
MSLTVEGRSALDALYWRAEILQAMYWMRGEGIATSVAAAQLIDFLVADRDVLLVQLHDLQSEGYVTGDEAGYELTALGIAEGGRSFQDEFGDLTRPAHYECGPGCWCQDPDHFGEPCPSHPEPTPAAPDQDPSEPSDE